MLADDLKRARQQKELTLTAVSQQVDARYHVRMAPSMLSRYEHGYSISINHLFALAAFYQLRSIRSFKNLPKPVSVI